MSDKPGGYVGQAVVDGFADGPGHPVALVPQGIVEEVKER
jgi:hypothetical protein